MLNAVTTAIGTVITWVSTVVTALVGQNGELAELLPLFAIGIAISAVLLGMFFYAEVKEFKVGENLIETIPSQGVFTQGVTTIM